MKGSRNMNFNYGFIPPKTDQKKYFIILKKDRVLVKKTDKGICFPSIEDLEELAIDLKNSYLIDRYKEEYYYLGELNDDISLGTGFDFKEVRSLFGKLEENVFWILGRAFHIGHWNNTNKFCGNCGTATFQNEKERFIECPNCGTIVYPRISPAIIVAITKGDKLLLAKNFNFKNDFYSVIAGFLEPGENLDECVKREVKEEVNIEVDNIKYFGSQPWPFPDSLMIGFTAEYAGGKMEVDNVEISHADWFSVDNLPKIPSSISISRKLIDWFIRENS